MSSALLSMAAAVTLVGCGISIPADPDGTLESVTGEQMRVGIAAEPGLIDVSNDAPSGPLILLVEEFADTLNSEPQWIIGSEESLVGMLEEGALDMVVGGISEQTPWIDRAGATRGYASIDGADGRKLVFLVPLGENDMLSTLEAFLDDRVGS